MVAESGRLMSSGFHRKRQGRGWQRHASSMKNSEISRLIKLSFEGYLDACSTRPDPGVVVRMLTTMKKKAVHGVTAFPRFNRPLRFGVGDQVFDPIRNRMQVISTILADSQPRRLTITPVVVCLGHFPRKALPARVFWNNVSEDFAKVHKVKSSDFAIYGIVARSGAVHAASLVPWLKLRRCPPIFFHPRNKE